jgi:hypothetical protein
MDTVRRRHFLPRLTPELLERRAVEATLRQLADVSGISRSMLHAIETGAARPSPATEAKRQRGLSLLAETLSRKDS